MPDEHVGLDEEAAGVAPGERGVEVLPGVGPPGLQGAQAVGAPLPIVAPAGEGMGAKILKIGLKHRQFCEQYSSPSKKEEMRMHLFAPTG